MIEERREDMYIVDDLDSYYCEHSMCPWEGPGA